MANSIVEFFNISRRCDNSNTQIPFFDKFFLYFLQLTGSSKSVKHNIDVIR